MKKNNRKPKSKKSLKNKGKNTTATGTVSAAGEGAKAAQSDGNAGRVVQKSVKAPKSSENGGISNLFKTVGLFLRQAKVELKKVKWPTRKELIASTVVVIVLTILVSFYLGLIDLGLIKIIKHVIG